MNIKEITDSHLANKISFFKKKLLERPTEGYYMGDSVYAEDAVEQENRQNEQLAEQIEYHIKEMQEEQARRKSMLKGEDNENKK